MRKEASGAFSPGRLFNLSYLFVFLTNLVGNLHTDPAFCEKT